MNDLDITRETPRLDPVPFIVADVILTAFAAFIGWQASAPLSVAPLAAISALVGLGAVAGLYPFVINHARRQEETLRERTEQIEALARTLTGTAEQVGIAVSSLPAISESSARQLKLAEQLPAAIQGQIATLQQQLSATQTEENAALRHELDTLRHAQTDKLASALADLTRLEALAAKHAAALDGAIAHLPKLAEVFDQQTAETLRRETAAAVAALQSASDNATAALATATTEARDSFDRGVRDAIAHLADQVIAHSAIPAIQTQEPTAEPEPAQLQSAPEEEVSPQPETAPEAEEPQPSPDVEIIDDADLDEPAPETTPETAELPTPEPDEPDTAVTDAIPEPETAPVAPDVVETAPLEEESVLESSPEAPTEESAPVEDDTPNAETESPAEPALSHDGYTRLIATAYIGIGNKLFIRGDGPGLRSDKGVPLQFVSIGKWRWESAELLFPATVRLYKNDQVECTALGEITLEPGHHHEVTAQF